MRGSKSLSDAVKCGLSRSSPRNGSSQAGPSSSLRKRSSLQPATFTSSIATQGQRSIGYDLSGSSLPVRGIHSCHILLNEQQDRKGKLRAFDDGRLVVDVPENDARSLTPLELLQRKVPKGYQKFHAALDENGTPLPFRSPLAPDIKQVHFVTFPAETANYDSTTPEAHAAVSAQRSFWLTAAYLLAAAVRRASAGSEGKTPPLLGPAAELLSDTSGGAGFSYDFFFGGNESLNRDAQDDPRSQVEALIQAHGNEETLDDSFLQKVEKEFRALVGSDLPVFLEASDISIAKNLFAGEPFKAEVLSALSSDASVHIVKIGDEYVDLLVPGERALVPLLPSTGALKVIRVLQWSRATWVPSRPSTSVPPPSKQAMIRLRAISFPSEARLKRHLTAMEEAAASDHRAIGKAQALFMTSDAASPGSPFILPHGMRVARKVERVIRDLYDVHGYDEVHSPQLFKKDLWVRSGHWENYRDDMFKVQGFRDEGEWLAVRTAHDGHQCAGRGHNHDADEHAFGLKPMNCPGHCLIFSSQERSYRDLPLRLAEFGPLHRNESSGSLSGLTRVRRFHQDDAHVFCTPDQVSGEIKTMLRMLTRAYRAFGFSQVELVLSTRPDQYIGELAEWEKAEGALRQALDESGRPWSVNDGDGAFYGPKIDCRLVDAAGKKHQTATIQLDFQLPRRFELRYADPHAADGSGHSMPVMIHRAILGSVERFMAILIESSRGRWPFWISPRQAIVLPVADTPAIKAHAAYVRDHLSLGAEIANRRRSGDDTEPERLSRPLQVFHVDQDPGLDTLGKMIRKAQSARYNFSLVVGEKEASNNTVSVRAREDYAATEPTGLPGRPKLEKDMGEWQVADLRKLFEQLDTNHW